MVASIVLGQGWTPDYIQGALMKLFMRSFYDNPDQPREMKDPMEYGAICLGCAGLLGGKMLESHAATMRMAKCGCCKQEKAVAQPRSYIWRT